MAGAPSDEVVHKLDPTAVEWRLVDDEVIALDLRSSTYIALNPTAAVLWQAMADGATESTLTARLVEVFDVEADQAAGDVRGFVEEMRTRALLMD